MKAMFRYSAEGRELRAPPWQGSDMALRNVGRAQRRADGSGGPMDVLTGGWTSCPWIVPITNSSDKQKK